MAKKTEKYIVTALNKETGNRDTLSIGSLTFEEANKYVVSEVEAIEKNPDTPYKYSDYTIEHPVSEKFDINSPLDYENENEVNDIINFGKNQDAKTKTKKTDKADPLENAKLYGTITLKQIASIQKRKNERDNFNIDEDFTDYKILKSGGFAITGKDKESIHEFLIKKNDSAIPFPKKEKDIVDSFSYVSFKGFKNIASYKEHDFFVPIFRVTGKDGSYFEYNMRIGKIEITG
jgi:hypothetical protein